MMRGGIFLCMLFMALAGQAQALCEGTPPQRISMKQSLVLDSLRQKTLEEDFAKEAGALMGQAKKATDDQQALNGLEADLQDIEQRCFMEALRNVARAAENFFTEDELKMIVQVRKLENKVSRTNEEENFMNAYEDDPLALKAREFSIRIRPTKAHAMDTMGYEFRERFRARAPASMPLEAPPAEEPAETVNNP